MTVTRADTETILRSPSGRSFTIFVGGRAGLAETRFLRMQNDQVKIVDESDGTAVRQALADYGLDGEVSLQFGPVGPDDLLTAECVVLSPGVPNAHPAVQCARNASIPIVNEIELAAGQLPLS